jgi:RNA polymerase sigma-70 factor (ECF subfamily)
MNEFDSLRPYLFSIAYRMLGSAMDAEDVVQDAYLRWAAADREGVRSPKAFLATIVTRLCINRLTSARAERESYIGVWLPEPVMTAADPVWSSPETVIGDKQTLSMAFMLLMESLTPDERAVFTLRAVFDEEYNDIAKAVGKSAAACRQLYHRARHKVAEARAADAAPPHVMEGIVDAITAAFVGGDIDALTGLLASDVTSMADGGGKVRGAGTRPVYGIAAVTAVLRRVFQTGAELGAQTTLTEINGAPGFVSRVGDAILAVGTVELQGGKISRIMYVLNPDKLQRLNGG